MNKENSLISELRDRLFKYEGEYLLFKNISYDIEVHSINPDFEFDINLSIKAEKFDGEEITLAPEDMENIPKLEEELIKRDIMKGLYDYTSNWNDRWP